MIVDCHVNIWNDEDLIHWLAPFRTGLLPAPETG
jgi:hypothetical protein